MNALSATGFLPYYSLLHCTKRRRCCSRIPAVFSTLKSSPPPVEVNEVGEDDVLQAFLMERKSGGDIIARLSDEIWLRGEVANFRNFEEVSAEKNFNSQQALEEEHDGGFLKLKRTSEWLLGDVDSAPMNKKMALKEAADDNERRKRLNFLRYEALKRELLLLTVGIGTACSGYCLVTLSVQAAVSYATGVLFRIGIRSDDLQDKLEKTLKGSGLALSSPRLVIPAAIYGLWELSQHFTHDIFDFQYGLFTFILRMEG